MEWKNAKLFMIVLLILLNGALTLLNIQKNQENILTSSQEKAVFQVMSQNGITLYTELLTEASPLRKLSLTVPNYGRDELKNIFFPNEQTTITVEFGKTIIKSSDKTLSVWGNEGVLTFLSGSGNIKDLNKTNAIKTAESFLEKFNDKIGKYYLGNIAEDKDGFIVEFYQSYKGTLIFGSNCKVYVGTKGITSVEMKFFAPLTYTGEKKDICFADEALLTFMKEVRKDYPLDTITVTSMELGYDFQDGKEIVLENIVQLVPCYRIYIIGQETPYIINAYTNEIIRD